MSLYKGYAQQKGFGANLVNIPDPADKIRQQGKEAMRGMEQEIEWNAKQADRFLRNFDENNRIEAQQRQQNFQDKQDYAQVLARGKWKNFETSIKNHEIRQKNQDAKWQAILSMTKSGAALYKMGRDHNRKVVDQFAEEIYRDYGIGADQFRQIQGLQEKVLNDNASLQGLLREWEVRGDVPIDVIARIRRGGGYMNLAVDKLAARRWANSTLPSAIANRSNEILNLPGMPKGFSLNTAKGPNLEIALQHLISDEMRKTDNEDGSKRFSNKILALAGVSGADGSIARLKASFHSRDAQKTADDEWGQRHNETINIIQDFIGPQGGSPDVAGARGIQGAIYYFAGGMDAPGPKLAASRDRVVDALDAGLRNGTVTWDQVRGLEDLRIYPKGAGKEGVLWGTHFKAQWNKLEQAGKAFYKNEEEGLELDTAHLKLEGKTFYAEMQELVASGETNPEVLGKLLGYAKQRGPHFEAGRQFLSKAITQGKTTINDEKGKRVLLARARNGEIITPQEIDRWNFSDPIKAEVIAEVNKINHWLPQTGDNGTKERLESFIDGELKTIIPPKSGYQHNSTHKDAKIGAMREAAIHYKIAREAGKSHEESYDYAKSKIKDLMHEPGGRWHRMTDGQGVAYFNDFGAKDFKTIEINREQIGSELHKNPDLIYSKSYIEPAELKEISALAHKGVYRPVHNTGLLIQSLTRGRVSAVDVMQAQLQMIRDREIAETGASSVQLLPREYVKRYDKESQKISPLAQRLLNTYQLADVNKAYVASGYQPPNQDPYYKKVNGYIETGDANNVITPAGKMGNSQKLLKYSVADVSVREVLMMMENGHFTHAGNALFDYEGLKEAVEGSQIGWEAKFNIDNQRKLQNWRFKTHGVAGFPHVEDDGYSHGLLNEIQGNLNTDRINPKTFYRSMAACNTEACDFMRANPQLFGLE